jgi:GH25 family lysozyme M1 (1,4-beta-N-acetylmuramidase)
MALLIALAATPAASAAGRNRDTGGPAGAAIAPSTDATTGQLEGIDVSHWQGTINWPLVAAAGKKFAILKATQGTTYTDPTYATNHAGAKAAGLWTGAYHFAEPDASPNDAALEAAYFVSRMNLGVNDLIPALDLEQAGGLSVAGLQAWVTTFMGEVTRRIGNRPMIYTSPSFWSKYMGNTTALADAGYKTLWIAHWGVSAPTVAANNWGGKGWTFWQYTSSGTVSGISGRVDLDRYNGTDLALQAYSIFSLAPATSPGLVKQGQSSATTVRILRTNFSAPVQLDVSGLPAGTTATFNANPSSDATASLTVTTPRTTPIGTYPLTISGVGGGMTRTTTLNLVVADGIPPTVTAPSTSLITGTLGSSVPVRVAWTVTDQSAIAAGALQRSVNATTWRGIALASAATRSVVQLLPLNSATQQRARATDARANTSAWSYGPVVRNALIQQASAGVSYSGTWRSVLTSTASGGSLRYSASRGAAANYLFYGSGVAWVAARGPSRGVAYVYLDGVYVKSVNLWASSNHSRSIMFTRNWATAGTHTLRIVVAGTRYHARVDVDAFVRLRQ